MPAPVGLSLIVGRREMARSQLVTLAMATTFLAPMAGAVAVEPAPRGPILPLAEYARQLQDPDLKKRFVAAAAIRDHYEGKSLEVLPHLLAALGEVLDQLRDEPTVEQSVLNHTEAAVRQAAYGTGSDRLKVIKESTRHTDDALVAIEK